jgi:Mg2+ and Co2+ transporter CorA
MPGKSILPSAWQLPPAIVDRLGDEAGRQRAMAADGHLLLILHAPPEDDDLDRIGRFFWRSTDGTWQSSALGAGTHAIGKHLDEFARQLTDLESQADRAQSAKEFFAILRRIGPLQRTVRNLQRVMQEARELEPNDHDLIVWRDRTYALERIAELVYADAKNGLDYATAYRAEQQAASGERMARAAHRLNLLAAFFFPIAALTAIFGTNLDHGFEHLNPPIPFLICLGSGILLGLVLAGFISRSGRG